MKTKFFNLFLILIFTGCKVKYVEVFKTDSTNTIKRDNHYVFENDSIKIDYFFWAENGIMRFSIYNKSNFPIYIDWKKSSYISNTNKLDYWVDETESTTLSFNSGYLYKGPFLYPNVIVSNNLGTATTKSKKSERITFIPPKTKISNSLYKIAITPFYGWATDYEKTIVARNGNPKKKTTIFTKKFSEENSPILFRNFLTFSTKEDFSKEFYVDNVFYVKEIAEMDKRNFGKDSVYYGTNYEVLTTTVPFNIIGTDFYVTLPTKR